MIAVTQTLRFIHINLVLLRHGLDEVLFAAPLLKPLRFLLFLSPWHWLRRDLPPYPTRVRQALEDLGPIFIKFGQILSTRRDLLPDDWADELARLQDRVAPFPNSQAREMIERAWGCPIAEVLDDFSDSPLASASIAQVHTGRLKDGRHVIVKVLRPGIERIIRRDIALMYSFARLAHRASKEVRRLRPIEVVAEYEKTIYGELDLQREAANASQLRRNWLNHSALYIPDVYWDWTRPNVMVMERIYGTPVSDVAKLKAQGISMRLLGERGVEIFFTQVFRDNFFHADMHPGNIFVEPSGRYISVDFGIVGSLTEQDQRYLAENLLAFFERNYRRVAELHVESGWVPPGTRVDEFEAAIRTVSEPIFEKPLSEISFGHFLVRLFQTARRFNMEIQPQLVLLEKTLLNIEGLGRQLYPELDLWTTAKPFMERWMKERIGPKALLRRLRTNFGPFAEQFPDMPLLAYRVLAGIEQAQHQTQLGISEQQQTRHERRLQRTQVSTATGAALLICATLLLLQGPGPYLSPLAAQLLALGALLSGAWILLQQWRAAS